LGVSPNAISILSGVFAAAGAGLLWLHPGPMALVGVALMVQLRLICNLLDGMVAVEGGLKTSVGGLYNEIPDRLADSLLIVALGYAAGVPWLGWLGALAAACTAYIRTLGGSLGVAQDFRGPMAKQQRMAVLTLACLISALSGWWPPAAEALNLACWIIAAGSLLTCVTRTRALAAALRAQANQI
jgi:phosphatidylglycerophosphate synthase